MDSKSIRIKLLEEILKSSENSWKRTALKSVYGWVSYFTEDNIAQDNIALWDAAKTSIMILLSACSIYLIYNHLLRPIIFSRSHQLPFRTSFLQGRNRLIPIPEKVQDKQVSERRNECTICADAENQVLLVPCGHATFCLDCIRQYIERNKDTCPICKQEIEQVVSMYF